MFDTLPIYPVIALNTTAVYWMVTSCRKRPETLNGSAPILQETDDMLILEL